MFYAERTIQAKEAAAKAVLERGGCRPGKQGTRVKLDEASSAMTMTRSFLRP